VCLIIGAMPEDNANTPRAETRRLAVSLFTNLVSFSRATPHLSCAAREHGGTRQQAEAPQRQIWTRELAMVPSGRDTCDCL
jgi:hypothetical protein